MALFKQILDGTAVPQPRLPNGELVRDAMDRARQHPQTTTELMELEAYLNRPPLWELN